jgi:hypothetical protein
LLADVPRKLLDQIGQDLSSLHCFFAFFFLRSNTLTY